MVNPLRNFLPDAPKPTIPDDFDNEADFLEHVRKLFKSDIDADEHNRKEAETDLKFVAGEQWDDADKKRRADSGKPALTINRLPAFVATLIGNRRLNETQIKVRPDNGGTKDIAEIREGLIRSIEKASKADRAYNKTYENQVITGMGNFQVTLDFADDDVFVQDINIEAIDNPLAVVWDRKSVDPTGADADHVFVVDNLPKEEFERRYPEASVTTLDQNGSLVGELSSQGWVTSHDVRVTSYWRMQSEKRILALMADGSTTDVTDVEEISVEELEEFALDDQGFPIIRETRRRFAQMYLVTGTDVLEGPYDLPIPRLPVFRAEGWVVSVGDKRSRFGLVRFMRDPQKLHNYWRSVIAEKLMLSPKAPWVAPDTAIEGYEKEWSEAHLSDNMLLRYRAESGQAPQRTPPAQMEPALINEASVAADDLRQVSNLHEASLGQQSNEVSGRAILARQRVGETGTVIYQDNLNEAIEEAGIVINSLIPVVYDTPRVIKVLGPESDEAQLVRINDTDDTDITHGKYMITLTTGPSFTTKRVEAAESMLNMVNAMPQTMAVAADLIIKNQDWPGAQEIARRLQLTLPPGMVSPEDLPPEQVEAQQQSAQVAQQQADLEFRLREAELAEKEARVQEALARAEQARAQAEKAMSEVGVSAFEAESDARDDEFDNRIAALKTMHQIREDNENGR